MGYDAAAGTGTAIFNTTQQAAAQQRSFSYTLDVNGDGQFDGSQRFRASPTGDLLTSSPTFSAGESPFIEVSVRVTDTNFTTQDARFSQPYSYVYMTVNAARGAETAAGSLVFTPTSATQATWTASSTASDPAIEALFTNGGTAGLTANGAFALTIGQDGLGGGVQDGYGAIVAAASNPGSQPALLILVQQPTAGAVDANDIDGARYRGSQLDLIDGSSNNFGDIGEFLDVTFQATTASDGSLDIQSDGVANLPMQGLGPTGLPESGEFSGLNSQGAAPGSALVNLPDAATANEAFILLIGAGAEVIIGANTGAMTPNGSNTVRRSVFVLFRDSP